MFVLPSMASFSTLIHHAALLLEASSRANRDDRVTYRSGMYRMYLKMPVRQRSAPASHRTDAASRHFPHNSTGRPVLVPAETQRHLGCIICDELSLRAHLHIARGECNFARREEAAQIIPSLVFPSISYSLRVRQ